MDGSYFVFHYCLLKFQLFTMISMQQLTFFRNICPHLYYFLKTGDNSGSTGMNILRHLIHMPNCLPKGFHLPGEGECLTQHPRQD